MAANLVRRYPPDTAHHLLNLSFAQYQADQDVVRLETRLARRQATLAELAEQARCSRGDVDEYRALVGRDGPVAPSARRVLDDELAASDPVTSSGSGVASRRGRWWC